jgi:Uma2 family endonuclease
MALPARPSDFERIYTSDEFETLPEFDARYELLDGRLVEKPMPGIEHGLIADIIRDALRDFDRDRKLGLMLQEVSTRLDQKDTPLPDLSFWKAGRVPNRTPGAGPKPDLAIEILSPRDIASKKRRDNVQAKIRKYQASGVSIVWVINPRRKTVEVYHPDRPEPVEILDQSGTLTAGDVIPGFSLEVSKLFEQM